MDKGTTDEIGKCVLTAALPKVWAREAVNSLSHSWRFGRDHPTCCKYPARRRSGGRSVRAGWRSPLPSLAGQLSRSGLWPLRGVHRPARKSPAGPRVVVGGLWLGIGPKGPEQPSHLPQVSDNRWPEAQYLFSVFFTLHSLTLGLLLYHYFCLNNSNSEEM